MIIFYRISDGSYPKLRFEKATKDGCFENFMKHFLIEGNNHDRIELYLDNVKNETWERWSVWSSLTQNIHVHRSDGGSSAAGFRIVLDAALLLPDDVKVYFVEDDYIHLPNSRQVLLEGLEKAHYVTLYNHPDKYIPASKGGNPLIGDDGAETTKVFVTQSSYWMLTNSTTMTFASKVGILREDESIWKRYTDGTYPHDMQIFLELRKRGRSLIQPIPTKSTHAMPEWAAHLHGTQFSSWEEVL